MLDGVEAAADVLLSKMQPPHMRRFGEVGVERLQDELRVCGDQVGRQGVAHDFTNCESQGRS